MGSKSMMKTIEEEKKRLNGKAHRVSDGSLTKAVQQEKIKTVLKCKESLMLTDLMALVVGYKIVG